MGSLIRNRWVAEVTSGLPRAERRSREYDAYVPDCLLGRKFLLEGDVAADVADAEGAIAALNSRAVALTDTEPLARMLLRAESVASSYIEGLSVGPRRLLRAEAADEEGEPTGDVTAEEVVGNIRAMRTALEAAERAETVTLQVLLDIHRRLLEGTRLRDHAGKLREVQNWIGGNQYNPCAAAFIPPPPGFVEELLQDLCDFCNTDALPAIAQAAIAHAQFETIHPFVDGNGRTGRALIHLILRRRNLTTRVQPPISLVLATRSRDYVNALTAFRFEGDASSKAAHDGLNAMVGTLAAASVRAVDDATAFENRCRQIEEQWRDTIGVVRKGSSADLLLRILPGTPIVTVKSAMKLTGRSKPQVNAAVGRLADAGILRQVSVGRRNRAFEAVDVVNAFTDLERQLASPSGNTLTAAPIRPVPRR